ncbi:hypothetical protein PF004_g24489 [Phytophthora fragariae]|uniref:Uncharacterized protein n=1 Tax=Phytophthora fragariae TaxID=53985 RepID=A0A6G0MV63_9STRA|nr:hypothetical protein PF004_g24489 [Phytophthora fragariae]
MRPGPRRRWPRRELRHGAVAKKARPEEAEAEQAKRLGHFFLRLHPAGDGDGSNAHRENLAAAQHGWLVLACWRRKLDTKWIVADSLGSARLLRDRLRELENGEWQHQHDNRLRRD